MENKIGVKIRNLRKQLNMTQEELAEKTGFKTKGAISRIESGQRDITQDQIVSFAKTLGTTPSYLMGWDDELPKDIILLNKVKRIPILGSTACGEPILAEENFEGYFAVDSLIKADFALYAKGDSMVDVGICEGDLCFIKQQPTVENGEIAVVYMDGESTLKRIYKEEGAIILKAENKNYSPKIVKDNVRILGKLVGYYHKV